MKPTNSKKYTQWDAAKFYSKVFLQQHRLAWVTFPLNMVTTIMLWGIPTLLTAGIIDDLQNDVVSN